MRKGLREIKPKTFKKIKIFLVSLLWHLFECDPVLHATDIRLCSWISDLHGREEGEGEERASGRRSYQRCTSAALGFAQTLHVCLCCICSHGEMIYQSGGLTGKCNHLLI